MTITTIRQARQAAHPSAGSGERRPAMAARIAEAFGRRAAPGRREFVERHILRLLDHELGAGE
jgi:hypothetical protein